MGTWDAITPEDIARFWIKVDKRGPDECWEWNSWRTNGYGGFSLKRAHVRATHFALWLAGKAKPSPDHEACHTCDNRGCVNPTHLWWGTRLDNMTDMHRKGRGPHASKTHCHNGHPLSGRNLAINVKGWRVCRTCSRVANLKYKHRVRKGRANAA